ncbi:gustatory receptor for bitter taste 93a-like [Bactrocera neohumeralis]|uniref:gustatory receptor for bitter taste 93a-like n=1 Tax=Bactrocera neohumeralis TaxID=98809 RepID=UPI002165BA16|nr:gustatory receptor for bitter taste 93a-like [Bactrocera neohumeralis]
MYQTQRSLMLPRIIGYFNILAIFLGLTRFRIDFKAQRVVQSRHVARFVICVNIAYLLAWPVFYFYEAMYTSSQFEENLVFLTESANMFISIVAAALSVLMRGRRERIHLELAETIIALDRRHFQNMCAGQRSVTHRSDHLLYFKMFTLCLQTVVPFYDWLTVSDTLDVPAFLQTFYYAYSQSILAMALFMYYHWLWVLRKRFCLLNLTVLGLLRRLQQMPIGRTQQRSVLEATAILLKISQVHALLNRLLSHLNRDYKVQILAVLLKNVIECISFGYYLTLGLSGSMDWEFDVDTLLFFSYAAILFVDMNSVYWISHMITDAQQQMSDIMRRFQVLPSLGDEFDQQCELFVMQLTGQHMDIKLAGMFQMNRERALAFWTYALTQIIVLVQFDIGLQLQPSTDNAVLNRLDKLFRVNDDEE